MIINSPLEQFEIKPLLLINNNYLLSITNYVIYTILIIFLINLIYKNIDTKLILNRWGLIGLSIYDTILTMVNNQIGKQLYFPLIFTLFNYILISNLISMIPYSFALSAQLIGIIGISISLWLGLVILGLYKHGWLFFSLFVPSGTPLILVPTLVIIEFLSYCSRAISLGLRLSANILSGHLLMLILGSLILSLMSYSFIGLLLSFIPILGLIAILVLEFAISIIQAYVFSILFCGYLKDSIYLH